MKNKTKHTPGPWRLENGNYARTCKWITDGEEVVAVLQHPDLPDFDATNNAQLISAAPDLLEALENLTAALISGQEHIDDCFKDAKQAINKAKGES